MTSETTPLLSDASANGASEDGIETIPPAHDGGCRTLVLLFDGTGDTDDDDISNVIALRNLLSPKKDDSKQLVWYQPGIGTYNPHFPGTKIDVPLVGSASRKFDSAIAWSLEYHVVEGYEWLMKNYRDGDKICLFGFSRGAYTARALSAMVNKVGLLPTARANQVWPAFQSFARQGKDTWAHSAAFCKENESRRIIIEFVGVWDTVNSVGAVRAKSLPYTASNASVRTFRHAVALDEHRARFRSNMWNPPSTDPKKQPRPVVTDVDQVWFAGGHCDVGGGSVPNGTTPNLADIALRWMVRECFKTHNGMTFNPAKLAAIGLAPDTLYPVVQPRPAALAPAPEQRISTDHILKPRMASRASAWVASWFRDPPPTPAPRRAPVGSEAQRDLADALAPLYDQLVINRAKWWALENVWLQMWSVKNKAFERRRNLGRGRTILPPVDAALTDAATAAARGLVPLSARWAKVRVHRTVQARMACAGDEKTPRYVPTALLNGLTLDKVDPALIEWVD
ncbi:hypothetical protein HYPSUDRAFT_159080 [Hypholoma sublateritium FD-334 SS-4]|uniref:T6SS Phospholipase effector Tle1-like catalytic domain-containing protein n=1 Tax=Hypholoma sublateritium (strain FD-334 SS-4) TaxID=945553 RepID=A0A0D2Q3N6_HYPSF|nr:hypothetical protein HYPSUDRAFT_159080 [Hypholoma sublateritium FD-334 SS-4]